ncbi:hypothetical protein Hypma_015858 [Hypsizygus marmoreus]|uniref:Uncharacterized protein n=1 Tax=Hypsizygus marmoreus TaxID=39966 RepID=A0A369K993_HYPMA|nr:hypothetical protein Hypma_015858 [Hypsizygus marmoreus]
MEVEQTLKHKVTVKLTYTEPSPSRPTTQSSIPRPTSPVKFNAIDAPVPIRPRAKVSATARRPATARDATTTPRPASPTKPPPRVRAGGTLSPTYQPKPRPTIRSNVTGPPVVRSVPSTPLLRHHRSQASGSDIDRFGPEQQQRPRQGSVSLHHAMSVGSLQGSSTVSSGSSHSPPPLSDHERSHSPSIRIKAKVSGVAKQTTESLSQPASRPIVPSTRTATSRARTASVSSNVSNSASPPSSSKPPIFYPITTATPAANPHRFATTRTSPSQTAHHYYQPFQQPQPQDDSRVTYTRQNGFAKVDPATIPLPPTSPPASAVSFSSRSSVSRSSVSYVAESVDSRASTQLSSQNGDSDRLRNTLDNLMRYTTEIASREDTHSGDSGHDRETDGEPVDAAERKLKAEAKSNRKIADLEITNRSLLAINASLESTKHRQAKEIRELRRKLRESRLILPPRTFRAVSHDDTADPDDADDEDEEQQENENENENDEGDEVYTRVKIILEGLLESGTRALERTVQDCVEGAGKGGAKVLSADEVRTWRDSSGGLSDHATVVLEEGEGEGEGEGVVPRSPALVPVPDSLDSEDEVEAMTLTSESMRSSPAPPFMSMDSH